MSTVATAFTQGKKYYTINPKTGAKNSITEQTAFDVAENNGIEIFEEETAPPTPTNRNRPQRKRAESWEAAKEVQDERYAENLGVPSNIAAKGIGFEFVGVLDTMPPIQEFTQEGKVRYQKVSASTEIDGKKTSFCLLFNPAFQVPGGEVRVKVVELPKDVAVSGRGLEQVI